jgi:hypothetical protein
VGEGREREREAERKTFAFENNFKIKKYLAQKFQSRSRLPDC